MSTGSAIPPFATTSRTIGRLRALPVLLDAPVVVRRANAAGCQAVICWGRKPSATAAERLARRQGLPLIRLEDGFLRSVDLGHDEPPLSIVIDDLGIYYDASASSRLERQIALPLTVEQHARAEAIVLAWRAARVSKYNHAREWEPGSVPAYLQQRYVLVVDQTWGDASIVFGLADAQCFQQMLDAALTDYPECTVILKVHPDVVAGHKRGHFDPVTVAKNPRIVLLAEDIHPVALLESAEAVYTVTSQMGFEGLLWGKPVHTFGTPFYAGWGLTRDAMPPPARRGRVTLEQLVHAALVDYPRYIDPERRTRCEIERVIEWMGLQRRMRERFARDISAAGFSIYKRPIVRRYFQGSNVRFVSQPEQPLTAMTAVWGSCSVAPEVSARGIVRLEDGFLRSVGLGVELVQPLSWVMDRLGIYYDATRPSDLEVVLQTHVFDDGLCERAASLRDAIIRHGLTKYNVGSGHWQRPSRLAGDNHSEPLRVILVPGQVERDASIHFGAADIRTNLSLLQAVRRANPDAYVVYKPHPDVRAGLRSGGAGEEDAGSWCDEIVGDIPMQVMIDAVDELHVLTSLAGFEALLRGKKVVTYGRPFYAGWGLTQDMAPPARRTRRLRLEELVAGVLILYPTYVSRTTGRFTTPERALEELLQWRERAGQSVPVWRRVFRLLLRWFVR